MYRFIKPFLLLFYLQFLFGIGGLGIYYNQDFFSTEAAETGETITVTSGGLENASGPGIFLYIDVIPFVDIQVDIENSNSSYNFSTSGTLERTLKLSRFTGNAQKNAENRMKRKSINREMGEEISVSHLQFLVFLLLYFLSMVC